MPRRALDRWQVLRAHVEDGVSWVDLAAHHDIPVRTLQRWHAAYQRDGLDGLTDSPRRDLGTHRLPPELQALIEGLALVKPRASVAAITRRAQSAAGEQGWKPPSYSVVRRVVEELDPAMATLAHDGPVSFRDRYELVWRRAAAHPNDIWQADHTELDVLILDAAGSPVRPWLTIVQDDHSRAVCGYHVFSDAPSAMNTGLALRQAIWPKPDPGWPMCGIPDVLYVDHGSDFTSHQLAVTALELKMRLVFSAVARPQGRGKIERFFGSINTELLPELPGFLAADQRRPTPVLTLAELSDHIGAFITSTYHQRVHPELGISPHQAWTRDGWLPRMPDSLESLDELLLTVPKTRIVHRDGIRFQGLRYLATTLAAYVGEAVTIRYDPRDITEIRVFHDNHFLCTAVDIDHEDQTLTLKDIQAARAARRRALRSGLNERIAVVAKYLPAYAPHRAAPTPQPTATGTSTRQPKLRTYLED